VGSQLPIEAEMGTFIKQVKVIPGQEDGLGRYRFSLGL